MGNMSSPASAQKEDLSDELHQALPGKRTKSSLSKARSFYSTVHDKHFKINEGVGHGIIQKRYLSGVLKVRVVEGSNLAVVWRGMPDPYVKISLLDARGWNAIRRTHTFASTCSPAWQEEFSFGIYREPSNLVLRLDVFDEDYGEYDDHLGAAMVPIMLNTMKEHEWSQKSIHLEYDKDNFPKSTKAGGTIEISLNWTPLGNRVAGKTNVLGGMCSCLRSPRAMSIMGSLQVNLCGFLLFVSYHLRWICRGSSLEKCDDVDVPGVGACTLIASTSALFGGVLQLMGSLGFIGKDWDVSPPGLISLLEDPDELEAYHGDEAGAKVKLDLEPHVFAAGYKVSMRLQNFILFGVEGLQPMLHFLAWLQLVIAGAMTAFSLGLAWAMKGNQILGEAVYVAAVVEVLLLSSTGIFHHAAHLKSMDTTWKRFQYMKWQSKKETNLARKVAADFQKSLFQGKERLITEVEKASAQTMAKATAVRTSVQNTLDRARGQLPTGGQLFSPK